MTDVRPEHSVDQVAMAGHGHGGRRVLVIPALLAGGRNAGLAANLALVAGAGAVAVSAAVHLHLWMDGYRNIATIGPLFLMQAIVGFAVGAAVAGFRRVWAALVAMGFVASTMAGFVLAVTVGIFGFQDTWSAPFATMAFAYETAALVLLAAGVALCWLQAASRRPAAAAGEAVPSP